MPEEGNPIQNPERSGQTAQVFHQRSIADDGGSDLVPPARQASNHAQEVVNLLDGHEPAGERQIIDAVCPDAVEPPG